jgi:polysaccharide deacetylase family protein (PEP-CTERM system associated)
MNASEVRPIRNALTIDVEDYFQVSAFAQQISRDTWDSLPCRIEANVGNILDLLAESGVHATFFTLGWIAERYPALIRRIVEEGHELASHGYDHYRATEQHYGAFSRTSGSPRPCSKIWRRTRQRVYRAPSFSVGPCERVGVRLHRRGGLPLQSRALYPIRHDHYGAPDAPRFAHEVRPGLVEVPVATVRVMMQTGPRAAAGISACCRTTSRGGRCVV